MTRGEYIEDFVGRMPHWLRRKASIGPEGIGLNGRLYKVEPCACGAPACQGWAVLDATSACKPRLRIVAG